MLFLLDSYEELAVRAEELNKLINHASYSQAAVLITSRPGSQLSHTKPSLCIGAQFQDFSEGDVKEHVEQYSEGDQEMLSDITGKFGMHFLKRPINLVVACYMYMSGGIKGLRQVSQTELFSRIITQLLLVYTDKTCPRAEVSLRSLLDLFSIHDRRLTGAKAFFREIRRHCCQASRKGKCAA